MMGSNCKHGPLFLAFWVLVLLVGITWLGNEMGWWVFAFPFLPLLVILMAVKFLYHAFKK
ncbi:hypothetical protein KJ891_00390 [Candidatus Micrarchaeota archaeon]|nr:hypothetical protein [Candidatus Micrarchaeota archaeon]